jgi:hypothetical protein
MFAVPFPQNAVQVIVGVTVVGPLDTFNVKAVILPVNDVTVAAEHPPRPQDWLPAETIVASMLIAHTETKNNRIFLFILQITSMFVFFCINILSTQQDGSINPFSMKNALLQSFLQY